VKRLDRYILKELMVPFLIGTLTVVLMFQANMLIAQLKNVSLQNVPPMALLQMILYKTPFFLNVTLPVAMSLAASLAISRLARESELTAMRSAGASIRRVVLPVALFGAFVGIGNYYLVEQVVPPAERAFRRLAVQVGIMGTSPDFYSNAMLRLRNFTVSIGTVVRAPDGTIQLNNILLVERPRPGETTLLEAESGEYRDGVWTIRKPFLRHMVGEDLFQAVSQEDMEINERIVLDDLFLPPMPEEQTKAELEEAIATARKMGSTTQVMEVSWHVRHAVPAAVMVFAIVAPIFAILFARTGGFVGVLLSIVLVFLYYNAFVISTEILGRNAWVAPWLAAWLPNILFAALGMVGLRRLE
jgi:lipopolysaccharide export system permease protein